MKRISSAVTSLLGLILIGQLLAQDEFVPGKAVPPLESLRAFKAEEPGIEPGVTNLSQNESRNLSVSGHGRPFTLPSLNRFLDETGDPLEFQRVDLFAPGARVYVLTKEGSHEFSRDPRQFFVASNRTTGVGLALDTSTGRISGIAIKGSSRMSLDGQLDAGIELTALEDAEDGNNICETTLDAQHPDSLDFLNNPIPESSSAIESGQAINYQAVIAIDTDNEWMDGKDDNPTTAMTWITDIFLAMNVFYERDIETRLLIGDVTLRIAADPYSVPSNRSDQLDEFGEYWRVNNSGIDRDFAAMFSGRAVCSGCFSGIAWIDVYCEKGFKFMSRTVGSYSFNAIGSNRSAAGAALFVGHEIGHNMGSPHTHCYNPAVDQCYNNEDGCYSGSVSCPAGGKGTVMSYCHVSAPNGAACGTSKSEFHPTVQALLENQLANNSPSCIAPYTEPGEPPIFSHGFESP